MPLIARSHFWNREVRKWKTICMSPHLLLPTDQTMTWTRKTILMQHEVSLFKTAFSVDRFLLTFIPPSSCTCAVFRIFLCSDCGSSKSSVAYRRTETRATTEELGLRLFFEIIFSPHRKFQWKLLPPTLHFGGKRPLNPLLSFCSRRCFQIFAQ